MFKSGVSIARLQPQMGIVIVVCWQWFHKNQKEFTITSGDDGTHSKGSFHPWGFALDIRSRHLRPREKECFVKEVGEELGPQYTVLNEPTHFHIQYNYKP